MNSKTRKITILAMLSAIAYIIMVIGRIPVVLFLKYDPKDVIITIAGFILGPFSSFIISLLVSFVEMFTVSDNGFIGFIMNIISTSAFACTASFIYKFKRSSKGAVIGLIWGSILMTSIMLLWNYIITPIYLEYPREAVVKMLIPAFLPFNLLKSGLNAALTMLLYKPVIISLQKNNLLLNLSENNKSTKINVGIILISSLILVTCILFVVVLNETI